VEVGASFFAYTPDLFCSTYQQQADQFIRSNPTVWRDLVDAARKLAARGRRFGMKGLVEWARWQWIFASDDAQGWKLNNNHTAYLARRLCEEVPECRDYIEFRRVRG
jgi:hypothetical protein